MAIPAHPQRDMGMILWWGFSRAYHGGCKDWDFAQARIVANFRHFVRDRRRKGFDLRLAAPARAAPAGIAPAGGLQTARTIERQNKTDGNATGYVLVDGKHYLVKIARTSGADAGALEFSDFDKDFSVTAPAADDVVDPSTLG